MRTRLILWAAFLAVPVLVASPENVTIAQSKGRTPAAQVKKIADNSFFIEEAYNQEAGVVQHVQNMQVLNDNSWAYSFTQEWPMWGQANQFSFTVPILSVPTANATSIGDILLNYRYQLVLREPIALSPRFTLVLPTGDHKKKLGNGGLGYQVNLPLSVELSDHWVTHWNIGTTWFPSGKSETGMTASLLNFNYGASLIWLPKPYVNLLLELFGVSEESVEASGSKERADKFYVSPGVRFAADFSKDFQMVPGIGFPIGVGPSTGTYGVFAYLSMEHAF